VQRGDRVAIVVLAAQQGRELQPLQLDAQLADQPVELRLQVGVGLLRDQLVDREGVVQPALERLVAVDVRA
jgi:hypothetical protein